MKELLFMIVLGLLSLNQRILSSPNVEASKTNFIGDGITGYYYQGYDTVGGTIHFDSLTEAFSRVDTLIDFWNGSQWDRWEPVPGWGDYYSVGWKGYVYIEETGEYGFGTISDDGSQIFIDSVLIVDNSELQWYDWEDNISEGDTSGTPFPPLVLDSGFHEISVRFYENASYDGIELWWLKPGSGPSDIPYYGTNFHGIPLTYNPNTNWELVPTAVLFTSLDSITSIKNLEAKKHLPMTFQISQNYPNPFNPTTNIEFSIPKSEFVTLRVYNILGEEVAALVSEKLAAGKYKYDWDANSFASGVYFYRIQAGDYGKTKKMILMK